MQKFELVLKNEKIKQYHLFALLIILISTIFFITLLVTAGDTKIKTRVSFAILIITAAFITAYFSKKRNKQYQPEGTAIFVIIVTFLLLQYWWSAIIIALLGFFYSVSQRKLIVSVNSSFIVYPSFPKRVIQWAELSNVILKDGLLTIDFRNNKLAQGMVSNNTLTDEKKFNEFCREQLQKNKNDRGNNEDFWDAFAYTNSID